MTAMRLSVTVLLAGLPLLAQYQPARPEFEVASIKPSPPQVLNQAAIGLHVDGAQVRISYLAVRDYLSIAYRVKPNQITGPDWIATEKFDISAKIPAGVKPDQVPEMLQSLLEDRFRVKAHRDTKEFPVYGLLPSKGGLKIQPLPADPEDEARSALDVTASGGPAGVTINFGKGSSFSLGNNKFQIKKLRMAEIADALSRFADRPVVDMTNAPGKYDLEIAMTPEDYRVMLIRSAINAGVSLPPEAMRLLEGVSGDSMFLSLETVGLKLETRKAPLSILVVDSVSKTPTDN